MLRKALLVLAALALVGAGGLYAAFQLSPYPSVWLIRRAFDRGAHEASEALRKHLPAGVVERLDLRYDPADSDAIFDLFLPPASAGARPPVIVWIHGGAWISGDKRDVANYLRVLAGQGFATVGINYTIAPGATYPTPVRQANRALAYLAANADALGVDASRVALAGDSAGAQIAAQLALVVSVPAYAAQIGVAPAIPRTHLRAALLHCGGHDPDSIQLDGAFGGFLRTVFWAYFGVKDFSGDPRLAQFSIPRNVTRDFPPAFISAGNADPLEPHSKALAAALAKAGAPAETLFFPQDHQPPLGHEYQFDLDGEAGRLALARSVAFLRDRLR